MYREIQQKIKDAERKVLEAEEEARIRAENESKLILAQEDEIKEELNGVIGGFQVD